MKKSQPVPLYSVKADYDEALKNTLQKAMLLHQAVSTVLDLFDAGADPKQCLERLREPTKEYELATHGESDD